METLTEILIGILIGTGMSIVFMIITYILALISNYESDEISR